MKKINFLFGAAFVALASTMVSCQNEDFGIEPEDLGPQYEEVFVYDFEAAAAAGENPGNFNGNQNNGQGYNAYSVKIRNDYKGYTWAEGSVLPEECHVWRRTDRINGNMVEGGLNCPNDREMAIDGLEEGYVVEITYAAEEGSELVWAVGEIDETGAAVGAGEGTPVATALIDGVEAVSGETIIPSGAKIEMLTVTPAVNGTGYLVFKVKKGTIISKVVISKPVE